METDSSTVIKNLKLVFVISTALLAISLISSLFSIDQLAHSSKLVNHTNEVLIETENMISHVKDAETNQRGYVITLDPVFLEPFENAKKKAFISNANVRDLTIDNAVQQQNLEEARVLIKQRFDQMQRVIDITEQLSRVANEDTHTRYNEMIKGKLIMDELRDLVTRIKNQENKLLDIRIGQQILFINYTPVIVIIAALISILITIFSFLRIKKDLEERVKKQIEDNEQYKATSLRINMIENVTKKIAAGNYNERSPDDKDDELGRISKALNGMTASLETNFKILSAKNWLQEGMVKVSDAIRGERDLNKLSSNLLEAVVEYLKAPIATIYINNTGHFTLTSSYAITNAPGQFSIGEGLIGQAAKNKKISVVDNLPHDFVISTSIGLAMPSTVIIIPLLHDNETIAVIEIGLLKKAEAIELEFLENNMEPMAIGINSAMSYVKLQDLLEETQAQTEELQNQHNELENLNSELETQAHKLQASEEELRVQQEELQQTNEELEERSGLLEEKNLEVIKKAKELEITTRYKSEFLANMSHELRTPLNSILLLSRLLSENNEKNLSADQVEYSKVIQSSGQGLLGLIDEILDLSKIEAGKMELEYFEVPLLEIADDMHTLFKQVAKEKNLQLSFSVEKGLPVAIETDKGRLEQILKNLISNALKFTASGSVSLEIKKCMVDNAFICFVVKDTGIGIAEDKQQFIFEAFQQADGSTRRKYGGTGLGLSISRELTRLLGAEIHLNSQLGAGSEFTLKMPAVRPALPETAEEHTAQITEQTKDENERYLSKTIPESIPDDRDKITTADKVILIIEDDTNFAKSLLETTREKNYKGVVCVRGDQGLAYARKYKPVGILLDIQLPVKSGWQVMDELKNELQTRHIPVHIMSSYKVKNESLLKGAIDFIDKPMAFEQVPEIFRKIEYVLNRNSKKVLIIEDNAKHASALAYYLESFNINSEVQSDISGGINSLKKKEIDCVILDMGIPDAQAYHLLEEAKKDPALENLPIIIFTGKSLSMAEEQRIKQYADSIVVKTAHSYQRMLDEVSLFLHLVEGKKKAASKTDKKNLGALHEILYSKTVLIVDDDVRNIFSLSKSLEKLKMNTVTAINGKEALKKMKEHEEIDIVLLDMMMPEMDGYETAKQIRKNSKWKNLPVIAVTAKAMTGDREKCISAGASDYITKPVDIDQLLSLLRVWLYENSK
jgi:signal transduction histidine kinase/DNA-binding response OmpR family regulator/CHASE3 domain sensor protein